MMDNAIQTGLRLAAFVVTMTVMLAWEHVGPKRRQSAAPARRIRNLAVAALGTLLTRIVFPAGAVGVAVFASERSLGIAPALQLPWLVAAPVTVFLLDLTVYLQHRLFHAVPALWRLHRVHHADPDFDATTGVRFHPVEILLSMALKGVVIVSLGAPPEAVLTFEILLNATALFNHGNVRIAPWIDRGLRLLIVTPDMHRIHHSIRQEETASNFGFNLPWWDRLFRTYRPTSAAAQETMPIGIRGLEREQVATLRWMLVSPAAVAGTLNE